MTLRLLEAFFRHRLLVLLPPLLIPAIVGPIAFATAPTYYEAWAGVWVSKPTYLAAANSDWNQYLSPAQNQAARLTELLRTRSFVADVARRTPLAGFVGTPRGDEVLTKVISEQAAANATGSQLLAIRFRAVTPELAQQVLVALLQSYQQWSSNTQSGQADLALSFYQGRLKAAEDQLAKSTAALRRYLAANPDAAAQAARPGAGPGLVDPQLADLQRRVEADQADVDRAQKALDQAQFSVDASMQGQDLGFQVVDPPQLPVKPTRELRKIVVFPIAGLLVGLGISAALLVILVASDRTIRGEADLAPALRGLGVVPLWKVKRIPRRNRKDAARRAVGFVAGAVLAAPRGAR